ncbi:S-adenosyl-L-methionine-dependent methyltransferase [Hypoxylon fragiforme]|uniref:S-adenosyl-L-methionine-dependent methyltransferase n=1 Tax=Hypoxylon fragiforme TaxID=63214 RepID=UPI0020C6914B|nr:S-adenosyl-L-methionine-dependent methyltransferase [Hypoxylon fragiforme]KAI2608113.1 S-adenosyl-L-methionine-dependent methyltransferase [Hypoxylon fragiforme]
MTVPRIIELATRIAAYITRFVCRNGFSLANNTDQPMYDFVSEHLERSRRLANIMVGDSQGFVCVALARKFHSIFFIVQDLECVVTECSKNAPSDASSQIFFMAHDFLTPQPIYGADVYFFRWIFHNWSDKYCIKILRNLILALKPGAKIINAKERELEDWAELFRSADERFELQEPIQPPGSHHSIMVVLWNGP